MIIIRVYPAKGLDGVDRDTADVLDGGTLAYDREFALYDADDVTGSRQKEISDGDPRAGEGPLEFPTLSEELGTTTKYSHVLLPLWAEKFERTTAGGSRYRRRCAIGTATSTSWSNWTAASNWCRFRTTRWRNSERLRLTNFAKRR
jgi:hypothetical protein